MSDPKDNQLQRMVRESFDTLKPPEGLNERTLAAIEKQRELLNSGNTTSNSDLLDSSKEFTAIKCETAEPEEAFTSKRSPQRGDFNDGRDATSAELLKVVPTVVEPALPPVQVLQAAPYREEISPARKARVHVHRRLAYALAACLILVAIGVFGSWWCFAPTAYVAIDVNPSIELSVNRFDYVVGERAINDDGTALLNEISVVGEPFPTAIEKLVTSEAFAPYTTPESYVEVNISCNNESQTIKLEEASTASLDTLPCHSSCHAADSAEWEAAQAAGMGLGRYRAVQELLALDPALTIEDCDEMSMRELRDRITAITGEPYTNQNSGHHDESHESSDGEDTDHHSESNDSFATEELESGSDDLSAAGNNTSSSGEHHGQGAGNNSPGAGGHHGYMGGNAGEGNSSGHHD